MELKALRKNLAYYKSQVEVLENDKRVIEKGKESIYLLTLTRNHIVFIQKKLK